MQDLSAKPPRVAKIREAKRAVQLFALPGVPLCLCPFSSKSPVRVITAACLDAPAIIGNVPSDMSVRRKRESQPGPLRRAAAAGCAALVLALTILAASPGAHGLLHDGGHDDGHNDHSCAVVMFANGVSLTVAPDAIVPPTIVVQGMSPVAAARIFLVSPRYLRQPERGPPVSGAS